MKNKLECTIIKIIDGKSRIFEDLQCFLNYCKGLGLKIQDFKIEKNRIYDGNGVKIGNIKSSNKTVTFSPKYYEDLEGIIKKTSKRLTFGFKQTIDIPTKLLESTGVKKLIIDKKNKNKIMFQGIPQQIHVDRVMEIIKKKLVNILTTDSTKSFGESQGNKKFKRNKSKSTRSYKKITDNKVKDI